MVKVAEHMRQTTMFTSHMVDLSILRLKEYEKLCPDQGFHLAFSGGKDSIVLATLAQMAGVPHALHYGVTTVDPPELVSFIRKYYPEAVFHRPERSMFRLIVDKGIPPTRKRRFCCEFLKEYIGTGEVVLTGIRWEESPKRRKRLMVHTCLKNASKTYVNPIIDWTSENIWEFIRVHGLSYCSLYDEGYKRIGCIMCPLASQKRRERDAERFPRYYNAYLKTFERMLEKRIERGLKNTTWKTGQNVMDWWLMRTDPPPGSDEEESLPLFA